MTREELLEIEDEGWSAGWYVGVGISFHHNIIPRSNNALV